VEKQILFRAKRLIRARNVVCLRSIFGIFQSPVDSFSESPGGGRMAMYNRIVMIRH
jgi:hypothetical protein